MIQILKKQKGTGTARAGSIKSGVFVGGGRFFGPRPRNYGFKLNKGLKRLARKSALSIKANEKADASLYILELNATLFSFTLIIYLKPLYTCKPSFCSSLSSSRSTL